jgi:hypothetical protein
LKNEGKTFGKSLVKWVVRSIAVVIAVLVVAFASLPLWMGFAIRAALPEGSISFERYERYGYGRFVLKDVLVTTQQAIVKIDSLEAYSPFVWTWKAMASDASKPFVAVGAVSVDSIGVLIDGESVGVESLQ